MKIQNIYRMPVFKIAGKKPFWSKLMTVHWTKTTQSQDISIHQKADRVYQPKAPAQPKKHRTPTAASYQHVAQTDKLYICVSFDIGGFQKKPPSSHKVLEGRGETKGDTSTFPHRTCFYIANEPSWCHQGGVAKAEPVHCHAENWKRSWGDDQYLWIFQGKKNKSILPGVCGVVLFHEPGLPKA